jgi:hypothetical protein
MRTSTSRLKASGKIARMLYGEFEELGGVEMIAARLNARNDDVPSMRALTHVAEMLKT